MDGYNAVIRIAKERPRYLSAVKKCVEAHHQQEGKQHFLGFEWNDVGVWPVKLLRLATEYDILEVTFKSNSATCYMVRDVEGVQEALQDIEAKRVSTPVEQGKALKIWLSNNTMEKLRFYLAKEFPDQWNAESLVLERALNLFLGKEDGTKLKTHD